MGSQGGTPCTGALGCTLGVAGTHWSALGQDIDYLGSIVAVIFCILGQAILPWHLLRVKGQGGQRSVIDGLHEVLKISGRFPICKLGPKVTCIQDLAKQIKLQVHHITITLGRLKHATMAEPKVVGCKLTM